MLRSAGCLLILSGGFWGWYDTVRRWRQELRLVEQMASDLEQMENEIALSLTPMPRLLKKLVSHRFTGAFFGAVADRISRGGDLGQAWREEAAHHFSGPARRTLMELRLDGDEASVRRHLTWAAQQLRRQAQADRNRQKDREKLCTALCASGALFLVILLL
ncbi:stage III sporulation protein AB [Oscillibacter hominis]|uniref:Stage III sporulation protein AB n=1 Tax=Oscillibacter hominis TaxID=2763056 RepID=A0A7G9B7J9_9FIRM|nr:stage III sporulation protein AB [Oscillibacter hominis]QNL45530.1 stage III sporulation protein AB [Oscillibacter hominis]